MTLNAADAVLLGTTPADRVYLGDQLVWQSGGGSDAAYIDFEAFTPGAEVTTADGWPDRTGFSGANDYPVYSSAQAYGARTKSVYVHTTADVRSFVGVAYPSMLDYYVRVWMRATILGNARIIEPRTSGGVITHQVRVTSTGKVEILDSASAVLATSTATVPVNSSAWFSVAARFQSNPGGSTGTTTVRIYTDPASDTPDQEFTATGAYPGGGSPPAYVYYGLRTTSPFTHGAYIGLLGYSPTDWVPGA